MPLPAVFSDIHDIISSFSVITDLDEQISPIEKRFFDEMKAGEIRHIEEDGKIVASAKKISNFGLKVGILNENGHFVSRIHMNNKAVNGAYNPKSDYKALGSNPFVTYTHINRPRDRDTKELLEGLGWREKDFPRGK